jgi:hypothetical protein
LLHCLRGFGFKLVALEDRSRDLDAFAAEKIFEYGSMEAYYESIAPEGSSCNDFFPREAKNAHATAFPRHPGYFLSIFSRVK